MIQLAQQAVDDMEQDSPEPNQQPYPTLPLSLPAALLAATIQGPEQ